MRKNNSLHIALEAVLRQKLDGLLRRGVHVEGTADDARLRAVVRRFKGAVIGGAEALVVVQLRAEVRVRLDEQTVAGADDPGDGDARIIALERGEVVARELPRLGVGGLHTAQQGALLIRQGLLVLHIGGVVLDLREGVHTGQHDQHALERRGEADGVTGGRARGRGSPDTGRGWGRK